MRKHIVTIIFLLVAAVTFVLRFIVEEQWQDYCDIFAFALPTTAALIEVYLAMRTDKDNEIRDTVLNDLQEHDKCHYWRDL